MHIESLWNVFLLKIGAMKNKIAGIMSRGQFEFSS